ncbi:MAG: NifB/NifX family molybdenum-iron cluster-binding protein [Oscillospiraceae bacterium]
MKVAVAYDEEEMIFQHFGHTERFKLYEIENGEVVSSELVDTAGAGHEALAAFLAGLGVQTLICGGIGSGAVQALDAAGIQVYGGIRPCGLRGGGPAARRPGPRPEPELPLTRGRPQLLPRRRPQLLPRVSPVPYR